MWAQIGRVARRDALFASRIAALSELLAAQSQFRIETKFVSLADFQPHFTHCRCLYEAAERVLRPQIVVTPSAPQGLGDRQPQGSPVGAENDSGLASHIELLAQSGNSGALVVFMESTLAEWQQQGRDAGPSENTVVTYLDAVAKSSACSQYDARAFVHELFSRGWLPPSLRLYNCLLELAVRQKQPAAYVLGMLKEMQAEGISPDWKTFVAAISCCTVNKDARGASKVLRELEAPDMSITDCSEALRARLKGALLNLAVAASKAGQNRDSIHFMKTAAGFGFPPSPAMVQETLQSSAEVGDPKAALDLLDLLEKATQHAGVPHAVDEGQCLSLLMCAVHSQSRRLAQAAWQLLKASLLLQNGSDAGTGMQKRMPLPVCYYTYIHAMALTRQLRPAFEAVAELHAAHPSACLTWFGGLASLVDGLSTSPTTINTAKRVLEDMLAQGAPVTSEMSDCIIAAAGQVRDVEAAFNLFDAFAELGVGPSTDTYSAVIHACVSNGVPDSAPMILREFHESGLQPNARLWAEIVRFYIVARNCEGILAALEDMTESGHAPDDRLLDDAISRLEREGHEAGVRSVLGRLGENHFRNRSARRQVNPARLPGGISKLTTSANFYPRQKAIEAIQQEALRNKSV